MFNALEESIEWPANLTAPPQLEMRPGAHGQILQMTGTNIEPRTSFNYRVRASSLGTFTVPEFVVQGRWQAGDGAGRAARGRLRAARHGAARAADSRSNCPSPTCSSARPSRRASCCPGSPGGHRARSGAAAVERAGLPGGPGRGPPAHRNDATRRVTVPVFIYETTLTPVTTGKLTVFAQGFTAGNRFSGPIVITGPATIPGGPPQYTLLESDPVELNVRPLPREGELPGFTGAIGSFAVGPPKLATNVLRVGDPVKLTVTITNRGDGPLARLVAPPPPQARDWQVFAATDFAPAQPVPPPQPRACRATRRAALSPAAPGRCRPSTTPSSRSPKPRAPRRPFLSVTSTPRAGAYVDLTIPSVPVTVKPGAVPGRSREPRCKPASAG